MTTILSLISLLLLLLCFCCSFLPASFFTFDSFEQCDHYFQLQNDQTVYINSPNYPDRYAMGSSCRYTLQAPSGCELKFTCTLDINSQSATHCTNDIFYFNREGSELITASEYFCGSGRVERKSLLNRAVISYTSRLAAGSYGRSGGSQRDSHLGPMVNLTPLSTPEAAGKPIATTTTTTTIPPATPATPAAPRPTPRTPTRRPSSPTSVAEGNKDNQKMPHEEEEEEENVWRKIEYATKPYGILTSNSSVSRQPAIITKPDSLLSSSKRRNSSLQVQRQRANNNAANNDTLISRAAHSTAGNGNGVAIDFVESTIVDSVAAAEAARVVNGADDFLTFDVARPHLSADWGDGGGGGGGSFSCLVEVEPVQPSSCECGWSMVTKVAGEASAAQINEFPSMAGVLTVKHHQIFCGATIIHQRYLISAAHCFSAPERGQAHLLRVLVGEIDLSTVFESGQQSYFYEIASLLIHEGFLSKGDIVRHDIALLHTRHDIEWNRQVGPACLPFRWIEGAGVGVDPRKSALIPGQALETAGWGTTYFSGPQPKRLLKTTLHVIATEQCTRVWPALSAGTFCTYTPGSDTCQHDSGGALYARESRLFAVGLVSYGFGCLTNAPSVNVELAAYLEWIESKTPEVKYCRK